MNNADQKLFEYAKESYYWEFKRKEQLSGITSIAITIIFFQFSVLSLYFFNRPILKYNLWLVLFIFFVIISIISLIYSLYAFFRHIIKYTYAYLSTPKEIDDYINQLRNHYIGRKKKPDSFYEREINETIYEQYLKHTEYNFSLNNKKSLYSFRIKLSIMFTSVVLFISFVFYLPLEKKVEIPVIRVENLFREVIHMSDDANQSGSEGNQGGTENTPVTTDQIPSRPQGHHITDGADPRLIIRKDRKEDK